jgi:hypothetical protein
MTGRKFFKSSQWCEGQNPGRSFAEWQQGNLTHAKTDLSKGYCFGI